MAKLSPVISRTLLGTTENLQGPKTELPSERVGVRLSERLCEAHSGPPPTKTTAMLRQSWYPAGRSHLVGPRVCAPGALMRGVAQRRRFERLWGKIKVHRMADRADAASEFPGVALNMNGR